jgi:S1-C subfamily serine protease
MNALDVRSIARTAAVLTLLMMLTGGSAIAAEGDKKSASSQSDIEQKLAAAQQRLDAAAREVADLSMSLSEHVVPYMRAFPATRAQRAMLGINLGPRDENAVDDGVRILSVSPGGAAAEAGLKADDVLLELNGAVLKREKDESPREKLFAAMRKVEPGDKVAVRYRRDGKVSTASLTAEGPADRVFMAWPFRGDGHGPGLPHMAFTRAEGVFGSAELVSLTPKLGQYFGTEEGLLVVRAPTDAPLKLEDGDVIVDIDGRTPTSPAHALRILGSYQPGESLRLNLMRTKKRMSIEVAIPDEPSERPARSLERSRFIEREAQRPPRPFDAPTPPPGPGPAI